MKTTRSFYSIMVTLSFLLLVNCEKENDGIYEKSQFIGEWEAYELIVDGETYTQFSVFNTYSTAIEFTENGYLHFIAGDKGSPSNPDSFQKWEIQGETLMLFNRDEELWVTANVEKLTGAELWLRHELNNKDALVKFKKM